MTAYRRSSADDVAILAARLRPSGARSGAVLSDNLGVAPPPAAALPAPAFGTLAAAVGGRYVLLGSALGGRLLGPLLAERLGPGSPDATRFFRRDGRDPTSDWQSFRTAVAAHAWNPTDRAEAVDAARDTFGFLDAVARDHGWARP